MTVLDLFSLKGKNALVTGGAKGIGTKINEGLLEAGVKSLIFCGRGRHGSLEEEKLRLKALFPSQDIRGITCDITEESEIESLIDQIRDLQVIDILVNSAGVTWLAPTLDQTLKSWHRTVDTNLTGTFLMCRNIIREMMLNNQNGGSIINVSSILGLRGTAEMGQIGYSATKSAILGLTRQLAVEFALNQIRVNAICPGFIEGETMAKIFTNEDSPVRETLVDMVPLHRLVSTNDIKGIIIFLASEASSYITGQTIVLGGGLTVRI